MKKFIDSHYMPIFIESTTLEDTWFKLLKSIWQNGRVGPKITSGSFAGSHRLSFDDVSGFIHYPHERPLAPLMAEGKGIAPSTTDEKIEQYFNKELLDSSLKENQHYKYANWIVGSVDESKYHECNVDQLQWIINHFKKHGYSNEHCYIVVGNPESSLAYDEPYKYCNVLGCIERLNKTLFRHEIKNCPKCLYKLSKNEALRNTSPCLRGLDFGIKMIDGINYLFTKVIYRSWDLYAGFPQNMGGFTLLNEFIASQLDDVKPGPLSYTCKNLHCYDHQIEILKNVLGVE